MDLTNKNNSPLKSNIEEIKIYEKYWKPKYYKYDQKNKKPLFSILLPPPNVTGHLHIGHAWDGIIPDVIWRYKKLNGYNPVWLPGTDHAGISTQAKYESILKSNGVDRSKLSDQEFLKGLKTWALDQSEFIHKQWAMLGLSLSYDLEVFTLDKHVYDIIYDEFIKLYNDKLIYRDYKIVNWDVKLNTAISDIEIERKEQNSIMYYIKYQVKDSRDYLIIATTRPETMFVDTNIFINPTDKRYKKYIGMLCINPINGKELPILGDKYIDIDFGTGIMKCTPAHDPNDYALAKKYNIKKYENVISENGKLNKNANTPFLTCEGIDRIESRKIIIDYFKKNNILIKEEKIINSIGYSQRSGEIVEPLLSMQWFVKMKPIVKKYRTILKQKKILNIIPQSFYKNLNNWLDNLDDWCISRQLLWGHQIPAWYHKKTNNIYVGHKPPKNANDYIKEKDVLDTWFSSGLWPIALTKYHPRKLAKLYPINLLHTGYDILTFWVSRMLLQCSYIDNTIPLKDVILHGLIRDKNNVKMSKSLGNVIDPIDIINNYGTDTLRMFIISNASNNGEDICFDIDKLDYYWSFINKIWNVQNVVNDKETKYDIKKLSFLSKYCINELDTIYKKISQQLDSYNFVVASKLLIDFVWNFFCNKFVEVRKVLDDDEQKWIYHYIYKRILILCHPFIPFTTEYINVNKFKNESILENKWTYSNKDNSNNLNAIIFFEIVSAIKDWRIKNGIKNTEIIEINISNKGKLDTKLLNLFLIKLNIKIIDNSKKINPYKTKNCIIYICNELKVNNTKLNELYDKLVLEVKRSETILANKNFIANAPKQKVNEEKLKYEKYKQQLSEISKQLGK